MSNKTLKWVLAAAMVGLVPQQVSADDVDALMSGSIDGPSDKRQKAADAKADVDAKADADAEDNYIEPDPWERPPADAEPPPKQEKRVIEDAPNPPDGRPLQLGLAVGYGIEIETMNNGANPYGLGFGIRGGYTLDMGMYIGLSSSYYIGGTVEQSKGRALTGASVSAFTIAPEFGYDVWLAGEFLFRPSAELGVVVQSSSADAALQGAGYSEATIYLAPGLTFLMPFAELFYVGADARLLIAFGDNGDGTLALSLVGGARLDI